jgi:hypothetical protein
MTVLLVCHCGRVIKRPQEYAFENRLNTLCYACAKARCDESTKVCPFAGDRTSDSEPVLSEEERVRAMAFAREIDEQRTLAHGSSRRQSNRTD